MKTSDKITQYLSSGGLFNPELMDHNTVRDLLIECKSKIDFLEKAIDNYNKN